MFKPNFKIGNFAAPQPPLPADITAMAPAASIPCDAPRVELNYAAAAPAVAVTAAADDEIAEEVDYDEVNAHRLKHSATI